MHDRRHLIAQGSEFFPAVAKEFKQPVICIDHREVRIKPAAENPARNVVIKMKDLIAVVPLGCDIHTHRSNSRLSVFRRDHPSDVMDPDVVTVLLFHSVLYCIITGIFDLAPYCFIHHLPVIRMHAVQDFPSDVCDKFFLICISQVVQHRSVDEIERESFVQIAAHHASGQGVIEDFLMPTCYVLHHQCFWVMLIFLLSHTGLCKVKAPYLPEPLPAQKQDKTA